MMGINTDTGPCLFIRCLCDHIVLSVHTGSLLPVFCMVEQNDVPPSERKRSEHAEFVLLKTDLLFSQITEAALQELGYTHTAAALATGTHTLMNNSHSVQIEYVSLKDGDGAVFF